MAKAWEVITTDTAVGIDQTEAGFWARVLEAYNEFKLDDAAERNEDQIHKKWGSISAVVKRFSGIYENNLCTTESSRSEADIRAMSYEIHRVGGHPRFIYWEEYLVLQDSPKFKAICEGEGGSVPKRTRFGLARTTAAAAHILSISTKRSRRSLPPHSPAADARASGSDAGAFVSGSRSGLSAPVQVLDKNFEIQMTRQLIEVAGKYESSIGPITKPVYFDLMQRLRGQLGMMATAAGDGDGDGDGDETADFDNATD